MARFSCAFRSAGAGSATLPLGSVWATTAVRPRIVEVSVSNTAASTAVAVALCRFSGGTGTKGSAITVVYEDDNSQNPVTTAANTHTVTPTTISAPLRQVTLGAFAGASVIWTFGGGKTPGLVVPNTANDGLGIIIPTGSGQVCDIGFTWDE